MLSFKMDGASNTNNEIVRRNLDLDKICRTCLEIKKDMKPLFEHLTAAMLMAITKVEVAVNDGLPSQLCLQCVTQISQFHSFKLMVEMNDTILRKHISFLAEEQLKREPSINENRPLSQCSVSRDKVTMDHEDTSLENVIKMEEVDLEPDYIECNTDVDTDMTDMDEQTENCDTNDNKQTDTVLNCPTDVENVKPNDEMAQYYNDDSQICPDNVITKIKSEIDTNDEVSGSELSKLHESEANTVVHKRDTEHVNNLHISDIYNESRPSTRSLTRHTTEKHVSSTTPNTTHKQRAIGTISCSKCSFRCANQSTLVKHNMKTHSGKVYSCNLCDYKCERERYLIKHNMFTHTDNKELFSCHNCDYKSTLRSKLLRHLKRVHTSKVHADGKLFSCNLCDYKSKRIDSLKEHKRKHTDELFSCNDCEYRTIRKCRIIRHVRKHTGERPFPCSLCSYRSTCRDNLKHHMKTHERQKSTEHQKRPHEGQTNKTFKCDDCNRTYGRKQHLIRHVSTHNSESKVQEKKFSCHICQYKFVTKSNLNLHLKTHTGEKPFSCSFCDYRCIRKYHLNVHMRRHTGEQPYLCSICGSKFKHKDSFNKHLKIHSNENCLTCALR